MDLENFRRNFVAPSRLTDPDVHKKMQEHFGCLSPRSLRLVEKATQVKPRSAKRQKREPKAQ